MNDEFDEPELAGYEPHGDRPLHGRHRVAVLRIAVVLGLIGLVLPGILVAVGTANRTALVSCAAYTAYFAPLADDFSVRFELVSAAGPGWNCYAIDFNGREVLVAALGIIPGGPRIPSAPLEET